MHDFEAIAPQLREMARKGSSPTEMLRFLANQPSGAYDSFIVLAMRKAFDIPLRNLTIIGGWSANGKGEITDARIDEELGPAIKAASEAQAS